MQDSVSAVVIKRDDGITHSQEAVTSGMSQPNISIAAMSAAYAVFVRTLRVYAQAFMGLLTAQLGGGIDAALHAVGATDPTTIVTPIDMVGKIKLALILALSPALFTLVQNTAELVMRLDEKLPRFRACIAFALLFGSMTACAGNAPPSLSPEASQAFRNTRAVKALDAFRDVAIAANAEVPPLMAEDVTRKIVTYHQSVVRVIQISPGGWRPATMTAFDELNQSLSAKDKAVLGPYLTLVQFIIKEATK